MLQIGYDIGERDVKEQKREEGAEQNGLQAAA